METPIYTSISVAALGGEWILAGPTDNTLKVYSSEDDIYNGTWEYGTDGNVLNRGYVKLEYYIDSDGLSQGRTNFYENDGTRLTFDDTLVKHLLAKITVFPEHLLFEFKSGVNITIEK